MSRIAQALEQIKFAREYTEGLLADVEPQEWFTMPTEGVTHIAWQVGHLAMAQYGLTQLRQRGKRPQDESLISSDFLKRFGKGSIPDADPANNPTAEEIRTVFDRVYLQTIDELSSTSDAALDEPLEKPHPMFADRFGALVFASRHELLHAGAIGLLRRLLGKEPLR